MSTHSTPTRSPLRQAAPRARADGAPEVPPAPAPARADEARSAAAINALAGIWLIIAPFVLGYSGNVYWNDIVFGAIVLAVALVRMAAPALAVISWINVVIGAWLFASAFWLDKTATASWNDVILGIIVFVLGVIAAFAPRRRAAAPPAV
jgi:SPW repeat